jgi:hypothetical protein
MAPAQNNSSQWQRWNSAAAVLLYLEYLYQVILSLRLSTKDLGLMRHPASYTRCWVYA